MTTDTQTYRWRDEAEDLQFINEQFLSYAPLFLDISHCSLNRRIVEINKHIEILELATIRTEEIQKTIELLNNVISELYRSQHSLLKSIQLILIHNAYLGIKEPSMEPTKEENDLKLKSYNTWRSSLENK